MRILLVNESARSHTGGGHRAVVETIGLLAAAGHEVALAYSDGGGSEVACETFQFSTEVSDSILKARWQEILQSFHPDLVQVHLMTHPFFLHEAGKEVTLCRFLHDQSWFCSGGDRMERGYVACHRPHAAACLWHHFASGCGGKNAFRNWSSWQRVKRDLALGAELNLQVASEFMKQGLLENGFRAEKIQVIPLFAREPLERHPVIDGRMVVASRLVAAKGVHLVLEALGQLQKPEWSLLVAGTGPELERLKVQARALGIVDKVIFRGEISPTEVDAEISRSELVISSTLRPEPFGLIGPEAMAHGKPLIAFDGGATPEWLQDGTNGVMLRQRKPHVLATAIQSLLADKPLLQKLGRNGRSIWERKYRPEVYLERLVGAFQQITTKDEPSKHI